MSFVDPTALKNSILIEVGDYTPLGASVPVVAPNLDLIWNLFTDKASVDIRLQYLYAKSKAIDYLEGAVWSAVSRREMDFQGAFSDQFAHLHAMKQEIKIEIAVFEEASANSYAVAALTQIAPVMIGDVRGFPIYPLDANDASLQGSPYIPLFPFH